MKKIYNTLKIFNLSTTSEKRKETKTKTARILSFSLSHYFQHLLFLLLFCFGTIASAQTVTSLESRCVNTGSAIVENVPGTAPFNVVVTTYPSGYDPVGYGGNRISDGIIDTFGALFPGSYVFEYTDASSNVVNVNVTVTGTYVIPGNTDYQPTTVPETNCISGNNGEVHGVLTNGLPPYTYTVLSGPVTPAPNNTGDFTNLPDGTYQIQAEDSCGNIQTRTVVVNGYTFSASNPVVNALSCTSYELIGLTVSPFPPGGSYEIVNSSNTVVGSGSSLPVTFNATKNEVLGGSITIRVKDACGDYVTVVPNTIANDWTFDAVNDQITCGSGVVINSINTTGTITAPYTTEIVYSTPSLPNETVPGNSFPYTLTGVNAATNLLGYSVVITDACGAVKSIFHDLSFYASGSLAYASCTATDATTNIGGFYNAPINYTISPDPNAAGTNTTGAFPGLPDNNYTITATDACGKSTTVAVVVDHNFKSYSSSYPYCAYDTFRVDIGIPSRAYQLVTITQYNGAKSGLPGLPVISTQSYTGGCNNNPNAGLYDNCSSVSFENTIANQTTTYIVTDACGKADTLEVTNGPVGHQPMTHSAKAIPRCINIGDITGTAVSDAPNWNSVNMRVWEINTPSTIINSVNTGTNVPTDYTIATNLPVGTYVVEHSLIYCSGNTFYDTVQIKPYTQPKIGTGLNFLCPPSGPNSQIVLVGTGGIPNYTFQLLNSTPAGLTLPNVIDPTTALYSVPSSYPLVTFRIIDQCLNGTTKSVPNKPAPKPTIKTNPKKLNGCTLPVNFRMYVDSTVYGSTAQYEWTKQPSATVIATTPSIPLQLPIDTGSYKVRVVIPGTCYDRTGTLVIPSSITNCLNEIGNYVWFDANHDGVQDANEVGIAGVTVTLYDGSGNILATTKTDAYGKYLFTDLPDGQYSVGFTAPINYEFTLSNTPGDNANNTNSDADPNTGKTTNFSLAGGESDLTADAGFYLPTPSTASLGDRVWYDNNKDGIQDASETGVSGVTVTLYDAAGLLVATTITDDNGNYQFTDLAPGTYSVGFTQPAGYVFTGQDANGGTSNANNSSDYTDSDVNPSTGKTTQVTLVAGEHNPGLDAGIYHQDPIKGALGDLVWYDVDNDGVQDANEAGVSGVTVNLRDASNNIIATTTTDEFGNYIFNNLDAGTYSVEFVTSSLPSGYNLTTQNAGGNDGQDSDPNTAGLVTNITLGQGEINLTIDAGIYNSTAPLGGLGTTVWYDRDEDGIQDEGENGVSGVKVVLYNSAGNPIDSTATDIYGNYSFNNLPDGTYTVGFSNLPEGYGFTTTDAGVNDSLDSDAGVNGKTGPIVIAGGNFNPTADAGIVPVDGDNATASLGDIVWNDLNNDGIQDPNEQGVAGVTVTLYAADGTTVLGTTTTDALGNYIFTNLPAGDYRVGFSNLPSGFTFSSANQGTDDALDADADASTGGITGIIHLNEGEDNMTIDAGIHAAPGLASLGNYVWFDENQDGLQDATESGVPGVSVTLYNNAGTAIANTTTDANGFYQFTGLAPDAYSVGFSNLPDGYQYTDQDAGGAATNATSGDANDSDVNPGTGKTGQVTLIAGQNYPDLDAGIFTDKAALGNYVWNDDNRDGIQDANESGVAGVTVTLYDDGGTAVASTVTDANGYYYFPNLEPGDYTVGFSNLPNGSIVTTPDASGSTDANDSDVDPNTLMTPTVSLFAGDNNLTLDMGIYTPLSAGLGNYTWIDANKNGLQDANEAPLAGVTVTLYNASGTPIATAITNGDGYYTFPDLGPGTYSVGFSDLPSIYQDGNLVSTTYTTQNVTGAITNTNDPTDYTDSDVDGAGNTGSVTLTEGEYNPGLDAGISPNYQYGSIGNYVWNDDNGNGLQDEPTTNGINGLMVYLYSAGPDNTVGTSDDALIDSTLTANDGSSNPGYYMFDSLMSGGYYVNFPLFASGRQITTQTATNQTDGNSDADALTGNSPLVTINAYGSGSDRDNMTIDAGYVPAALADLGNYVWNDINKDGIQDPTEVGVAGITITLYDNANNIVSSTVTDAYGKYLFEDLQPGIYKVGFTLPSNYVFTTQDAVGTDSTDSDVDVLTGMSGTYTLMAGDSNMTVDAGIYFTQPNTASVGNYVWYDNNQNGIQDPGETGISGVTVTLYNASGVPVGTTVTDANGFYLFSDVTPGTYSVGFTPPVGLGFSPNNGGVFDPSNSDANPLNGMTSTFTVNAGDEITTVDAGLYQLPSSTASLGDKVWYDTNQDGIQDADEVGVAGVTVTLYDGTGTNVIATTTTNAFGNYIFNNLTPGDYIVGFSNIPSGYVLTNNTGTDSTTNSDANPGTGNTPVIHLSAGQHNMTYDAGIYSSDPNLTNSIGNYVWNDINKDGIQDGTEQGVAGVTATLYDATNNAIATAVTDENGYYLFPNLPNGTYYVGFSNTPVGFSYTTSNASGSTDANDSDVDPTTGYTATTTLTGNTHDMTLDAGIFIGSDRLGKGTLGDKVWYDLNNDGLQDPNEGGVQGVTVTLYEADGTTVIATTTTDALGNYIFTNLDAGTFVVGFSNLPAGFTITGQNTDAQGVNGESNSDADPTTGKTTTIALAQGEDKMSVDMGIVPPANTASLGNYVWIDLNNNGLQDANEPGVPGVTVTLYDNAGNVLDVTTTDANGMYQYVGLTPGTYGVGFSNLPNGYSFTTQDADASGINGATNSDANTTTGLTATVTLAGGDNNPNLDAGIVSTTVASVGDYVWHDLDGDGEQDANEPGVGGVLVTLYDNTGNPVASTITKPDGSYIFTNVTPGDYTMGFTNIPGGMIFTTQETDPNSNTGSNANPTTGRTTTFTVTAGTHNPTIDAGILAPNTAGLGNYVWFDMNKDGIQDANEPGIPGVLVTLYAADGTTVLATAVTDGNGFYTFTNLPAGSYIVGFNTPAVLYTPDGARVPVPTTSDATADANDSDADALTGKTTSYTLAVGEYNPTIDGGFYYQFATPVLWNNFELSSTQCDAQLTWTTIEDHTAYYSILRRQNGNFEEVAKVTATGNNSLPVSYEYTDANLTDGIFEYKIKAVNIDNTYSYSPTRSIKMNCTQAGGIQVYPNPIVDELHIDLTVSSDELIEVVLTDAVGKVVAKQQNDVKSGANTITVQTQHLAAGSYFVTVHANGTTQVSKISKK